MHVVREANSHCTALVRKQAWFRQAVTRQEGAGPLQLNLLANGYHTCKVSAGPDAGGPVRASSGARSGLGRKGGNAEAARRQQHAWRIGPLVAAVRAQASLPRVLPSLAARFGDGGRSQGSARRVGCALPPQDGAGIRC